MRLRGATYADIAAAGGGILNSARRLADMSDDDLLAVSLPRVQRLINEGTGALEIKSGYGLSVESELKMLRVARRIGQMLPVEVRTTFLGAHAVPSEFAGRPGVYLDVVINEMLPAVAAESLADYVDIFCESGYFSVADMERLIRAGADLGLPAKVHVNQFNVLGGIEAAVRLGALSVDHLEVLDDADVEALCSGTTLPVLLPGCSLFLSIPFAPARRLIDAGLPVVLASDFNPGSSPSGNMSLVAALACLRMGMLPEEAIIAATINGAAAMGLASTCGSITPGKWANLWISKPMSGIEALPYHFGHSFVDRVLWHGAPVASDAGWF
jgi:imidazolonepropionase